MYWFTSDEHYNHAAIIDHTLRPFLDWKVMNQELIKRFNSRVGNSDTTFHLGDFKFGANGPNVYELKKLLNGDHVFIWGNHDRNNGNNTPMKYAVIKTYGLNILLVHTQEDATMFMQGCAGIDMAFVGHSHHNWKFKKNLVNVGVDVWDFYPVGAKQILKAYRNWEMGRDKEWLI